MANQKASRAGAWRWSAAAVALMMVLLGTAQPVQGHHIHNRWTRTNADGFNLVRGTAITLTWSYVPDGGTYSRVPNGRTNLIAFLDDAWHVDHAHRTPDLTNRAWWGLTKRAYDQFERVSGLTMVYVPEELSDGTSSGQVGEIRIGGTLIDGVEGRNVVADNLFPNNGDMRIDTSRESDGTPFDFFGPHNEQGFINLIAHESGHGVGIDHSLGIVGAESIMEPILQTHFFGLQFDDVYAFNRNYGDPLEKQGGNDTFQNATGLGALLPGSPIALGTDANDTSVLEFDDDWVGIDGSSDTDYFRFTLLERSEVDLVLTPQGPTYTTDEQGPDTDYSAWSDLNFALFDAQQAVISSLDQGVAGEAESIAGITLDAGDYVLRVAGDTDENQFYRLDLAVVPEPASVVVLACGYALLSRRRR